MITEKDPKYYFDVMWEYEKRMHPKCTTCKGVK